MAKEPEARTVLVTGAAGGMGRELTARLLDRGWKVAAVDLVLAPAPAGEHSERFLAIAADGASLERMNSAVAEIVAHFGGIDAIVTASGLFAPQDFVETTEADWALALSANLLTVLCAARAAVPVLQQRGGGSIVTISSTAGEYGSIRPAAAYAAAKGGVIALTKSLARELADSGIRVNSVSPGPVATPMLGADTDAARELAASRTLIGRVGEPSDIAHAVIYLLDDTASWVTGTVLQVNGGSLI